MEAQMQNVIANMEAFTARAFTKPVYSDEYIEHWAEVYLRHEPLRYGVLFGAFLEDPHTIVEVFCGDRRPLLPAQRAVQSRVDQIRRATRTVDRQMAEDINRPGRHVPQVPALRGDHLVQPMQPREYPARYKTRGGV